MKVSQLDKVQALINLGINYLEDGAEETGNEKIKQAREILNQEFPQPKSVITHIWERVREIEKATKGLAVLQFAPHPKGIAMMLRVYLPNTDTEIPITDVIHPMELNGNEQEITRIDVLFDLINKELSRIQTITKHQAAKGRVIIN